MKIRDFSENRRNMGIETLVEILDNYRPSDSCIEFSHRVNEYGYSILKMGSKTIPAHRFAYYWFNCKPVNTTKCVMHSCDNPRCINPQHLSEGTWADNNKDRANKGRTVTLSFYRRKLTPQDIDYIKERFKNPYRGLLTELSQKFGVDNNVIYKARDGAYDDWSEPTLIRTPK